ncbi:MAG: hypothetical protein KHZ99_12210 [Clostridium sp.]|uniref:PQQ-dependent sugar dehydrogenase n=1 Tax=Clostridium sp. TaxID=1506 RepID=UPI0025C17158|nr:hypothetical protein [Clostridium sp.]MBS4957795.1 hypothetical protein [Clostridium sp.]
MWRFLKFLIFSIIIVSLSFGIYKFSNRYDLNLIYENVDWSINTKGLGGAVSFDFDKENNLYIAFKNTIKMINKDNKEEILVYDKSLNIYDIACYNNDIIIASDNRVLLYDVNKEQYTELINNLPNNGLNHKTNIILNRDYLYISIGSNTNSGIVDENNKNEDKASFEWESTGIGYNNNYAFVPFGEKVIEGQKIKENVLSNASILRYDLNSNEFITYATGIRNVEGLAIDSLGKLTAIVGGMEDSGVRAVKDDADYIYNIKEKAWYGWPDFSGGDPITSPRFSDGTNKLSFVIANHPTEVILGPRYQHDKVASLKGLTIDYEGKCFPKDTVIFADNVDNYIYVLTENDTSKVIVELDKDSHIEKIKYNDANIYILDSKGGCLYKIGGQINTTIFNLPNIIWIFIIVFVMAIIIAIMYKSKMKKSK